MPRRLLLLCLIGLVLALPARATSTIPLYLDDIIATASVAFEGTCTGNRTQLDPSTNLVVTYTTFAVHDVIKGSVGLTFTIKQVGGDLPQNGISLKAHGIPTFAPGRDYVVFLTGVSRIGFSSPVGLSQGRFAVESGAGGAKVSNGRDFREMTANIPDAELPPELAQKLKRAAQPVHSIGIDEFKRLVRTRPGAR